MSLWTFVVVLYQELHEYVFRLLGVHLQVVKIHKFKITFSYLIFVSLCNKNQQNPHILHWCLNLIIVSSTCFEHPSVHPQEDLYMQFNVVYLMLEL
jgi:hypothetical protein